MPPSTSSARRIRPAQVPMTGTPDETIPLRVSNIPRSRISFPMTVLSPPGRTSPSAPPSRSDAFLISKHRAPSPERASTCSLKAPCTARTPMRLIVRAPPS